MSGVAFNGQVLTKQHMEVIAKIDSVGMNEKAFRAEIEKAFEAAGIPVPQLKEGQVIYWASPTGEKDRGAILSIDRRSGKITADSKLRKRPVKLSEQQVRVNADDL